MYMFSGRVRSVTQTNIFARSTIEGRQYVVYSMRLDTPQDVAMILPIPVKARSGESAVRFINLEEYPDFFTDLHLAFPSQTKSMGRGGGSFGGGTLQVHQVGSFEASYVPTVRDFDRLNPRFRLPDGTWDRLPQYKNYGFTVFKLKPGAQTVHPMAFEFPRADARRLFFPTVHIHDGKVYVTAVFDHALFCQKTDQDTFGLLDWRESERFADDFVKVGRAQSLIIPKAHLYMKSLRGRFKNEDIWIA